MTTVTPAHTSAANLDRITADLAAAQADADLLERLKSAGDRLKRLTAEHDKAAADHRKAVASEAKAAEANRFAGISNIRVAESPNSLGENVVRSSWTISYTKPAWDGYVTAPREHSVDGFSVLPSDVLDCIIEKCPERIPAKIMALAPDDAGEAFGRYFLAMKRGYVG